MGPRVLCILQDDRNILYANLVLPSTLFAAVQTGDVLRWHTSSQGFQEDMRARQGRRTFLSSGLHDAEVARRV